MKTKELKLIRPPFDAGNILKELNKGFRSQRARRSKIGSYMHVHNGVLYIEAKVTPQAKERFQLTQEIVWGVTNPKFLPIIRGFSFRLRDDGYMKFHEHSKAKRQLSPLGIPSKCCNLHQIVKYKELLAKGWDKYHVHHISEVTLNNLEENLLVVTPEQHRLLHKKKKELELV